MEEAGKHGLAILGGETPLWKLICLRLIFKISLAEKKTLRSNKSWSFENTNPVLFQKEFDSFSI